MNESRVIQTLAESALTRSWREICGPDVFGIPTHPSYVSDFRGNLLTRVKPRDFEKEVRSGGENELGWYNNGRSPPKFHAAYSSAALVINSFSPFRRQISDLAIFDVSGFSALSFEAKLPTSVSVPNLDVLCEGSTVVAIESKCIEYLRPEADAEGKLPFKPTYQALEHLLDDKFGALYEIINRDFGAFAPLNVTQIVKHYLGIKSSVYPDRPVILGYLFWESTDRDEYPVFAHHRNQVVAVSDLLRGSTVRFQALSYAELWQEMLTRAPTPWVADHIAELRRRYDIPLK